MTLIKQEIECDSCGEHYFILSGTDKNALFCPFCQFEMDFVDFENFESEESE